MAQTAAPRTPHAPHPPASGHGVGTGAAAAWARGGTIFAGVLLFVDGTLGILKGIAGIISNNAYRGTGNYLYRFSVNHWGWTFLGIGIVAALVGLAILARVPYARFAGVGIAVLSIVANFAWLPFQPTWAFISIAINTFVIWALCTRRRAAMT